MTTVAISQPMYFPWAGFMEMMKLADVFVWLDDVQFSKGSFTNRIQVKTPNGVKWMTIPLQGKGTNTPIRDLVGAGDDWRRSHRAMLKNALATAPCLAEALEVYDDALEQSRLSEVLIRSCEAQARLMAAMPGRIVRIAELDIGGVSWRRVIEIVKAVGGSRYISGAGGANYLDHVEFDRQGLSVEYMAYNPLPWPQQHGEFTPYVTGLDLIAACGAGSADHLRPVTIPWRERLAQPRVADEGANHE